MELNSIGENESSLSTSPSSERNPVNAAAGLKSNRTKAIIFANLFSLFQFFTAVSMKIVMKEHSINALDISMIRNIILLLTSYSMIRCMGLSLYVEESKYATLIQRSIAGCIAF